MRYASTRGGAPANGPEAVLKGLAPDGGLYVDETLDQRAFPWEEALFLPPLQAAARILGHLLPDYANMEEIVRRSYAGKFDTPALTPLVSAGPYRILELFHGPTSAFKDVALSVLPLLMTEARRALGASGRTVILTATSGDTGKAALEGFHDVDGTGILVFYPDGGVSPVQKAQMVTQAGRNVKVCAVRGNFDDCQTGVKRAFAALREDPALAAAGCALSSANSINIGRLAPQVVYYFLAYRQLLDKGDVRLGEPVDFVVPTGNFGDIFAGFQARQMGLPVGRLVCASNANRVLTDFFESGCYDTRRRFLKTASPSMDILVSSNLERLLYLAGGRDAAWVSAVMTSLAREGVYTVPEAVMGRIREVFAAGCCEEADCRETIRRVWRETGYLADPHTAVALKVTDEWKASGRASAAVVTLSTASPFKFPQAVREAISAEGAGEGDGQIADPAGELLGQRQTAQAGDEFAQMEALAEQTGQTIPPGLAGLKERAVRFTDVIDASAIAQYVRDAALKKEV